MKRELDFNVLSRSLGYYGAKENFLMDKWRKYLNRLDASQIALSIVVSEFLEDLSIPAENFFLKGDFDCVSRSNEN